MAFPPQRLRPDTRLEHQDPVCHMAQKKREKKRKKKNFNKMKLIIKIKIIIIKGEKEKKKRKKRATKPINKSTNDNKL